MPYSFRLAAERRVNRMCLLSAAVSLALLSTACGGGSGEAAPAAQALSPDVAVKPVAPAGDPATSTTIDLATLPAANTAFATGDDAVADAPAPDPVNVALAPDDSADGTKTAQDSSPSCLTVPPIVTSAVVRDATTFGAKPDDGGDDTDAIQRGLNALQPGETLYLPPGRYLMSRSLHMKTRGTALRGGTNAILHGTNPDDQAVLIENDDITVADLTFTAVTANRRTAPRHSRIAIAKGLIGGDYGVVFNAQIRNNKILGSGPFGSDTANGASGAAILLLRAQRFLVAGNTVERSLADGIHITMASRNGRVLNNTVRETGDDMIAIVSYAQVGTPALSSAADLHNNWGAYAADRLSYNILIAGNNLSSPYWGRGISVIGGQSVTISGNVLQNIPLSAPILLSREAHYMTFGVGDVVIENNTIRDVQTMRPTYDYQNLFATRKVTGHGAIEINNSIFYDEAADPMLNGALSIHDVVERNNIVERSSSTAARMGTPYNGYVTATNGSGQTVRRDYKTGAIVHVGVQNSRFSQIAWDPIVVKSSQLLAVGPQCSGNTRDGAAFQPSMCKGDAPVARGAVLVCGSDGRLN